MTSPKPVSESKFRPFDERETPFLCGKPVRWVRSGRTRYYGGGSRVFLIVHVCNTRLTLHKDCEGFDLIDPLTLVEEYEFLDGTPCGVEIGTEPSPEEAFGPVSDLLEEHGFDKTARYLKKLLS